MQFFKKLKLYLLRLGTPGWLVYKGLWLCKVGIKVISNGRFRSETFYGIKPDRHHHQIYTYTAIDRYPDLFTETAKYFQVQNNPAPKILSFGCSTGEEVFTLGNYMPSATIIGIDINQWCVNQCRKKNNHPKHFFYNRNSGEFENSKDFDAIFCMAVLQRTENRTSVNNSVATGYTFSKFESEVMVLHKKLKAGGLFIIDEADFSFLDTRCADNYEPLQFENNQILKKRPLFDKNNQKQAESQLLHRIFLKVK